MQKITSIDELKNLLDSMEHVSILKHSTRCEVSAAAYSAVQDFERHSATPFYYIHVIENREISNFLEEWSGLRHESPQLLIFKNKMLVNHASHFQIKYDFLKANSL